MVNKYFYCYEQALNSHLKRVGHDYILHAFTLEGLKEFWLYEKDYRLIKDIERYEERSKNNENE